MKNCHVCGVSCEDNAELCPVCGAEFINCDTDETEEAEEIVLNEPVLAASIDDFVTAQIFCDMLSEEKVPYSMGEDAVNGGMQVMFGGAFADIDIYVDKCDYEKSQDVYEKLMSESQEIEEYDEFEDSDGADI